MNLGSENLDYPTVDTAHRTVGYVRTRMSREEKRVKHRIHQRNFVLRQRERLEELRHELRCYKLQLLRLRAAQETAELTRENDLLRHQLVPELFPTETVELSTFLHLSPSGLESLFPTELQNMSIDDDCHFIFELMALLPETNTDEDAKVSGLCWAPFGNDDDLVLPPWLPTTPCGFSVV